MKVDDPDKEEVDEINIINDDYDVVSMSDKYNSESR